LFESVLFSERPGAISTKCIFCLAWFFSPLCPPSPFFFPHSSEASPALSDSLHHVLNHSLLKVSQVQLACVRHWPFSAYVGPTPLFFLYQSHNFCLHEHPCSRQRRLSATIFSLRTYSEYPLSTSVLCRFPYNNTPFCPTTYCVNRCRHPIPESSCFSYPQSATFIGYLSLSHVPIVDILLPPE